MLRRLECRGVGPLPARPRGGARTRVRRRAVLRGGKGVDDEPDRAPDELARQGG